MKTLILTAIIAITLVSCNQKNKETENNSTETVTNSNELFTCSMHPEVTGKKGEECPKCGMELTKPILSKKQEDVKTIDTITTPETKVTTVAPSDYTEDIIISYINLKNKLVNDNSNGAADNSKTLLASLQRFDTKTLNAKQKKEFLDIADDAKEHAEHIANNAGKIDHQREHFATLSKDINDLIKMFGTNQKLYQDYCPMYNDGKGAIWISETKEIKNPFYGSQMLTCGSLKKTL
ncbi:DUF3347 domain-containing protein [Flavobacterium buctense]|uniref:DUF3347 domain-containing protein n=1 Tax=Flavobacterium buctense TaxID=1648146 RepID=UPI00361B9C24